MKKTIDELGLNVIGGQSVARLAADKNRGESGTKIGTIVAKTVKSGYLSREDIVENEYKAQPDSKRITRTGDIVVKLTQPIGACLISKEEEGLVVSSFCAIINGFAGKDIDSRYLAAYLNSSLGAHQIASLMGGSTVQTISVRNLKEMPIPFPKTKERQVEIGLAYEKAVQTEILSKKLAALQQEKLDAMICEAEVEE